MADQPQATTTTYKLINDAAVEPALWPEALASIETHLGVENVNLVMNHRNTPSISSFIASSLPPEIISSYLAEFPKGDVWIDSLSQRPAGKIYRSSELYPDRKLVYTKFYEEFLKPIGLFHCAGGFFERDGDCYGMMSALLPRKAKSFNPSRLAKMALINKHLREALHRSSNIALIKSDLDLSNQLLGDRRTALALTSAYGTIIYATALFEALLKNQDIIRSQNGQITFADGRAQNWLQEQRKAIQKTGAPSLETSLDLRSSALEEPLTIRLFAINNLRLQTMTPHKTHLLISIHIPRSRSETLTHLQHLGVTPVTSLVAWHLLAGLSAREVSQTLNTSYETTRSHIKRLLRHFNCSNQRQLLNMLDTLTG